MNDERRETPSVDDILNEFRNTPTAGADEPTVVLDKKPAPDDTAPTKVIRPNDPVGTPKKPKSKPVHTDDPEPPAPRRSRAPVIAMLLFLALVIGAAGFAAWAFLCQTIYPGVSAGGTDVGGMTLNEASAAITDAFEQGESRELTLELDGRSYTIPVDELVSGVDATETARAAFLCGREGSPIDRALAIVKARFTGTDVPAQMDVNKRALRAWLNDIGGQDANGPVAPSYEIVEDELILDLGAPGVSFGDRDALEAELLNRLRRMDLEPLTVDADVVDQPAVDLAAIQAEITTEPKNASIDPKDGVSILEGVDGISMDLEEAARIIGDAKVGTFTIPLTLTPAEINAETLKSMLFRDTLGAASTKLNPNEVARTHNVTLACKNINGTILNPGDEFSYNGTVGQRTAARGFKEAGIFSGGKLDTGLGGGVCQPSSTLYMAVLRADLKVTERTNHGMTVSYTPLGEDATVSWGTLDFKFVNDTDYPVKIVAVREGSYCKMTLLGTKTTDKTVELKTNILSKTDFQTVEKEDVTLKPGEKKVDQTGSTGYKTETFKIITENGKTTTVKANNSNYKKRDKLILVGPAKPEPPITPPVTPTDPVTPPVDPVTPPFIDPGTPVLGETEDPEG